MKGIFHNQNIIDCRALFLGGTRQVANFLWFLKFEKSYNEASSAGYDRETIEQSIRYGELFMKLLARQEEHRAMNAKREADEHQRLLVLKEYTAPHVHYRLGDVQPVACSYIGDQPDFYDDYIPEGDL